MRPFADGYIDYNSKEGVHRANGVRGQRTINRRLHKGTPHYGSQVQPLQPNASLYRTNADTVKDRHPAFEAFLRIP
jgi:hypothetical protein